MRSRLVEVPHPLQRGLSSSRWKVCCPPRRALSPEKAASEIRTDVAAGQFDPVAAQAVLEVAGHERRATRSPGPSGLTAREREVLALLAVGEPNKAIARRLGISAKTVGNHVEHVYAKLGVGNRAGASLIAMQRGIVGAHLPGPG